MGFLTRMRLALSRHIKSRYDFIFSLEQLLHKVYTAKLIRRITIDFLTVSGFCINRFTKLARKTRLKNVKCILKGVIYII